MYVSTSASPRQFKSAAEKWYPGVLTVVGCDAAALLDGADFSFVGQMILRCFRPGFPIPIDMLDDYHNPTVCFRRDVAYGEIEKWKQFLIRHGARLSIIVSIAMLSATVVVVVVMAFCV